MGATTTRLMTFAEFAALPEEKSRFTELRHGELIQVTFPKPKHLFLQFRLYEMLRPHQPQGGFLATEFGFRALPEYEYRAADVAWVSAARWSGIDLNEAFQGVPELVIEVLSPSNTATEMFDREKLCLENGCHEFWVVDSDRRQVKISTPDGITTTYTSGQTIPRRVFGRGTVAVDDIFDLRRLSE